MNLIRRNRALQCAFKAAAIVASLTVTGKISWALVEPLMTPSTMVAPIYTSPGGLSLPFSSVMQWAAGGGGANVKDWRKAGSLGRTARSSSLVRFKRNKRDLCVHICTLKYS